ncbi:MAG: 16S rRNA (guanine(966)-N(2))-methyltransferase RsmD [Eubacterium sp.]|nr:16S rRNA (guanine(966)-N(2))-methyltransferase RsmD [Eubacterium sp.]
MRVVAGKCRSLPLKAVPGKGTRPTTDRIKETLFNIIQSAIPDAMVLDLFAGSGALGIEALSRGAAFAWFVDSDRKAVEIVQQNLAFTKLTPDADVLHMQAVDAIRILSGKGLHLDIVFLDPPYGRDLEKEALIEFHKASCTDKDTLFIVEAAIDTSFSWLEEEGYSCIKEKQYKTNKHLFIKQSSGEKL